MKKLFTIRLILICILLTGALTVAFAGDKSEANRKETNKAHTKQILIVGLPDNVRSNYFYKGMIAEETGMVADSIDILYNHIIAENIAASFRETNCRFILDSHLNQQLIDEIKTEGEEEECYANLAEVPNEELQQELNKAGADYLLVLNQHYLKWQEEPLRTLFHIVSYTLFDKEKNEICRGNNFFTSMNLEKAEKIRKISKKSSSRIASSVIKTLDDQ